MQRERPAMAHRLHKCLALIFDLLLCPGSLPSGPSLCLFYYPFSLKYGFSAYPLFQMREPVVSGVGQ